MKNIKRNKPIKRILSLLTVIALLVTSVIVCPVVTSAADAPSSLESSGLSFWADPENSLTQQDVDDFTRGTSKTTMTGAVGVFRRATSENKYYLFLPSNADCTNLKLWFSASTASINGTTLVSGEYTSVFADINEGGVSKEYTLNIGTNSYTLVAIKSGDVGTVYIDTQSGSISEVNSTNHDTYTSGTIMVIAPDGTIEYDGIMEKMSGRGNGTWDKANVKNPYNVKLAVSTSLLGMPKAKKWVLLANADDDSLVRNQITYDFAKYIGVKYQPVCKPVDLYVNQQYYGSYSLSEKVEIKSNRINVTDAYDNLEIANGTVDEATGLVVPADLTGTKVNAYLTVSGKDTATADLTSMALEVGAKKYSSDLKNPDDYSGGYLYELEISKRWTEENAGFGAYARQGWVIKSTDYASKNMLNYSYDLLYALGSSVYNGGVVPSKSTTTSCSGLIATVVLYGASSCTNPAPASQYQNKKWNELLDADSAVKYYWTQEYFKNMDSSTSSTYFYKDSDSIDSMIYAGPVWDMDNAIGYGRSGSRWGHSYTSADDWYTKNTRIYRWRYNDSTTTYSDDKKAPLSLYGALATNCSDFWSMAQNQWYSVMKPAIKVLNGTAVDETGVLHDTAYYINTVAKSGLMNNMRISSTSSYDAQGFINGFNDWFNARDTWITSQLSTANISSASVEQSSDCTYNGLEQTPSLSVTYEDVALVEGEDYSVSYSNNINAGTATATLTGLGRFSGTKDVAFTINKGTIGSVEINEAAYVGDTLEAVVKMQDGVVLTDGLSYQWKTEDGNIDGANASSYTISDGMQGKNISVTVTGNLTDFTDTAVTSNSCFVYSGERPTGYTKTIASWDYDYSANETGLVTADETGSQYYYAATNGEKAATGVLTASVNALDNAQIKWSGSADLYANPESSVSSDQSPVMSTSKTNNIAWGEYPYFTVEASTIGFGHISFSARLGGSKKGPRDWKLQYSLDGVTYTDIENATYSITKNKNMEQAFDMVSLPAECDNKNVVYIRVVAYTNIAINGINTIVAQTSGDASINNIRVYGASTSIVTSLSSPTITTDSIADTREHIYNNNSVIITDTNGGADLYYSINGGEDIKYEAPFNPFTSANTVGDTVTVSAYAKHEEITSELSELVLTYAGDSIVQWSFENYSQNVSNGAVFSNGGAYDESAKMTAVADSKNMYVPYWHADNKAFLLAPDDGALWSADSGFYYELSTVGYSNIAFSAKAYTTAQGPKSVQLQYSLDGKSWSSASDNITLTATGTLSQLMYNAPLPAECANKSVVYIRLVTVENLTCSGTTLHNSLSKGNLYVNDIIVSGNNDTETLKMPYTNRTTDYFSTSAIKYHSVDGVPMKYSVIDSNGNMIMSGDYVETGIDIYNSGKLNTFSSGPYTVSVWEHNGDDASAINVKKFYYKGETVTKFNYNDTTKLFADYVDATLTSVGNTSGAYAGTLSMYPNAQTATTLSYTGAYGVKTSWASDNRFTATKVLDNEQGNGYWLIKTSSKGYCDLTLNLEQISSNKGPRDWGVAYSTDGVSYTFVAKSNVRAISNDATNSPIESYNNLPLPSGCDNADELYIKIFINGGESVDSTELESVVKGNTGINGIELSGVRIPQLLDVVFTTKAVLTDDGAISDTLVDGYVFVNGNAYETKNGSFTMQIMQGESYSFYASINENATFASDIQTVKADVGCEHVIGINPYDANGDGVINAKDYAMIYKYDRFASIRTVLLDGFDAFYNTKQ